MAPRRPRHSARNTFAANLRQRRVAAGLSQEAFAHECGLHRTYIGAVERSEKNISIDSMEKIANALQCSLSALLEPVHYS
jgi:transcriptional regulator with XRE-family HTH domain